jgi:hypothetical protein
MNIGFTNFGDLDKDAIAWANRCPTKPSGDYLFKLSNFIKSLKSNGTWWKIDLLQIYAAEFQDNATTAIIGVDPTLVSTPTFTRLLGITTNGSSNYINTNFANNTSVYRTQNLGGFGYYTRTNLNNTNFDAAANTTTSNVDSIRPNSAGSFIYAVNATQFTLTGGGQSGPALFAGIRTNATTMTAYKNGTLINTRTQNSTALINRSMFVGARNNNGTAANFIAKQFSMYFNAGFNGTEYVDFYNSFNKFRLQVGF